jgi:hypothetical protein
MYHRRLHISMRLDEVTHPGAFSSGIQSGTIEVGTGGLMAITDGGVHKAWELLGGIKPDTVCRAAVAGYDAAADCFTVRSFGQDIAISLKDRTVSMLHPVPGGRSGEYNELFPLAVLWYLVLAKDIVPTGRLVRLEDLPGGDIFAKGSHVLPLEKVAERYGNDKEGFLKAGLDHDGEAVSLADAAVRLAPLPRVPVTMTLWLADEEFPARAGLLFDSTCSLQLPTDILWSLARLSCLALL